MKAKNIEEIKKTKKEETKYGYCPKCNSDPSKHKVRNFNRMWGDGDVYCTICESYVRGFDTG